MSDSFIFVRRKYNQIISLYLSKVAYATRYAGTLRHPFSHPKNILENEVLEPLVVLLRILAADVVV